MAEPEDAVLTTKAAAKLCGRTDRWLRSLTEDGHLEMKARGKLTVGALISALMSYYEARLAEGNKAAAANRATDARTREIELRIAEREGKLLPIEDCEAVVSEFAAMVLGQFSGLAASITRDLALRQKIDEEVDRVIDRLRSHAEKQGKALRARSVDLDEGQAADAE